jgi:hypothetical protein
MQVFANPVGPGVLWFDNTATADGTPVAYDPQARAFVPVPPYCANREIIGCNWIAPEPGAFCRSCAMTALAPETSIPTRCRTGPRPRQRSAGLSTISAAGTGFVPRIQARVRFLTCWPKVLLLSLMGHADGVVTISVAEADPVLSTTRREALHEPYRTMIGHMRHEIAHMLWWRLSLRADFLDAFRSMFGDERADYQAALQRHYGNGPPVDWRQHYLTTYASAHPHEDWAETAAHLLHLTDICDSVAAGLGSSELPYPRWDPYAEADAGQLIRVAVALVVGVNHINRSMGLSDVYPFVLSETAQRKLAFVHDWLRRGAHGR